MCAPPTWRGVSGRGLVCRADHITGGLVAVGGQDFEPQSLRARTLRTANRRVVRRMSMRKKKNNQLLWKGLTEEMHTSDLRVLQASAVCMQTINSVCSLALAGHPGWARCISSIRLSWQAIRSRLPLPADKHVQEVSINRQWKHRCCSGATDFQLLVIVTFFTHSKGQPELLLRQSTDVTPCSTVLWSFNPIVNTALLSVQHRLYPA